MSNVGDVLQGIGSLVGSLDAVLRSDTLEALITLVKDMRISAPVKSIMDVLGTILDKLVGWLDTLGQVAAVPRLLEVFTSPVLELGQGLGASGAELKEAGLSMLVPLADATALAVRGLESVRLTVQKLLQGMLPADALRRLRERVLGLKTTLAEYGQRLAGAA